MENENTPSPVNTKKNKRTLFITGGVMLVFGIYLLAFLLPDVLQTASGSENMTLVRAAEVATDVSAYVSIEDGEWDCDTIVYIRRRASSGGSSTTASTEIFLTDSKRTPKIVIFATMSGRMACGDFDGLNPTGYLTRMSSDQQQELTNEVRLARFFNAETVLALCGYCGTENSLIGLIFGIVITLGGIGIIVLGFKIPKK
jgi:hypothetical protein